MSPAIKCTNGKWKWGEYGECSYDSKQDAEKDNEDYYRALEDIDLTPTNEMIEEAQKGLEWRKEYDRGGTEIGVGTANAIINNSISLERVKRMYAYFSRHEIDKEAEGFNYGEEGYPSAGRIAWALWSGDAGFKWAERKRNEIESEEEKEENKRDIVGYLVTNGIELPLFETIEEAEEEAERLGGSGFHEHTIDGNIYYMPFESHAEAMSILNPKQDNIEEVENDNNDSNEIEYKSEVVNIWDEKYDNSMEKRLFNVESRVEQTEEGKEIVKGHASVYDSRSEFMGFYEYIAPDTFTQELIDRSDVRALINHDANLVLARSKNGQGTLKLFADERGLAFEYELPETSYGKDLGINLKNGNISQSSFAFTVSPNGDNWSTDEDGNDVRTITKIDRLFDISQVTYAAYSQAESDLVVAQRGLQVYKEKKRKQTEEQDFVLRSLAKLKIELKKRK